MAKLTLNNISSGHGSTALINSNSDAIQTAMENTLSRDGTSPNQMGASLDMNSNKIINLPPAGTSTEPVTLSQLTAASQTTVIDASVSTFTPSGTGAVLRTVAGKLGDTINVHDFGAVGDDSTDDAAAIQAADTAAAGGILYFVAGKTYRVTSEINPTCEWNLNGARIHLVLSGNVRGIEITADKASVHGGIIKKTSTGTVTSGEFQCHVKAGRFDSPTGLTGVRIYDLTLETAGTVTNTNGICIASNCVNFEVGNITADDSALLGRVVLAHWGNLADYASTGSGHPHNGWIHDIDAGAQTLNATDQAAVFLSGCYDVEVERVDSARCGHGFLVDYVGDHGFQYASAAVQAVAQRGNTLRDSVCLQLDANSGEGVKVNGEAIVHGSLWYPATLVEGVTIVGAAATNINGFELAYAGKARVVNCKATTCLNGVVVGIGCKGASVRDGEFVDNGAIGISVTDGTVPPRDTLVEGNYCARNVTAGVFTSAAYRTTIARNELGDRSGTDSAQDYGIQIGTADRSHEVTDNHFHAYATAGILTATSAGQFLDVINGNTFDDLTAPIVGQDFLPYAKVPTPDGTTITWHGVGNATPEGSVTAPPGSTCAVTSTGKHYTKASGTGNTGWAITGTQT